MHHEFGATAAGNGVDELQERVVIFLLVHAQPAFHRDRHADRILHGGDALGDHRGFLHQTGAEAAGLHPIRRAADIEVDFGVTVLLGDAAGFGEVRGITAAELQGQGLLAGIMAEQTSAVAEQHRLRMHHFGIQSCFRCQQAVEHTAVAVGPVHHRRDGKTDAVGIGAHPEIISASSMPPSSARADRTARIRWRCRVRP